MEPPEQLSKDPTQVNIQNFISYHLFTNTPRYTAHLALRIRFTMPLEAQISTTKFFFEAIIAISQPNNVNSQIFTISISYQLNSPQLATPPPHLWLCELKQIIPSKILRPNTKTNWSTPEEIFKSTTRPQRALHQSNQINERKNSTQVSPLSQPTQEPPASVALSTQPLIEPEYSTLNEYTADNHSFEAHSINTLSKRKIPIQSTIGRPPRRH